MRFEILDVEHGFCAYAVGRDGGVVLFDCGRGQTVSPSSYLPARGVSEIHRLVISNYDEDHIDDLVRLRRRLRIRVLTRNASLTTNQIRSLKQAPISEAMLSLLDMIDSYTASVEAAEIDPDGIAVRVFSNPYPMFTDTNNLSLLTFLEVGGLCVALGGDLETSGWTALLGKSSVRECLGRAEVFVASHHGRRNGYCAEVFDWCTPSLVVMSDGPIRQDTQRMASVYGKHARGTWFSSGGRREVRKVVTTRNEGNISWDL